MRRTSLVSRLATFAAVLTLSAGVLAVPAAAQAASVHWNRPVRLEPTANGGLNAVSCPTAQLCVAVDASGNVVTTTRPTAGSGTWRKAFHVDSHGELTGVSCASTTFCAAVDDAGDVVTSTDPTGGSHHWTLPARIDGTASPMGGDVGLNGVSCPTSRLCVAVDGAGSGNVVVSTDPGGGAGTWHLAKIGGTLSAVSCASSTLCVVSGSAHWVATDPAGGAAAWHGSGGSSNAVLDAIDCPTVGLCAAVGFGNVSAGLATASANPRGGEKTWTTSDVESSPPPYAASILDAVGCLGGNLCVALGNTDDAFVSTRPARGGWSATGAIRSKSAAQTSAISCTSTFCVVVDSAGVATTGVRR